MKELRKRAEDTAMSSPLDAHVTTYQDHLLLEKVELLETAEREDAEALKLDMAEELGVKPSVLRGKLTTTRQRLDRELQRAEVNKSSQEAREASVAEIIEEAVVDLEKSIGVKRSRQAAKGRGKALEREKQLHTLIQEEVPGAERAERERWPDGRLGKTNVNKRIQESLADKGHMIGFRKIQKARAKRA